MAVPPHRLYFTLGAALLIASTWLLLFLPPPVLYDLVTVELDPCVWLVPVALLTELPCELLVPLVALPMLPDTAAR